MAEITIVTDEPRKYDGVALADGVTVHHRDELTIQRQFREIKGYGHHLRPDLRDDRKRRRASAAPWPRPTRPC